MVACCSNKKQSIKSVDLVLATPDVVIYKTTNDYTNNVPVIMDAECTRIVRYPAPADVRRGDAYATPIKLDNGYLLDCMSLLDFIHHDLHNLRICPCQSRHCRNITVFSVPLSFQHMVPNIGKGCRFALVFEHG